MTAVYYIRLIPLERTSEPPRPAVGVFPRKGHRTMAEVERGTR